MDRSRTGRFVGMEAGVWKEQSWVTTPMENGPPAYAIGNRLEYSPQPQERIIPEMAGQVIKPTYIGQDIGGQDMGYMQLGRKEKFDVGVVDIARERGSKLTKSYQPSEAADVLSSKLAPSSSLAPVGKPVLDLEGMPVIDKKRARKKVVSDPDKCEERVDSDQLCSQIGVQQKPALKRTLPQKESFQGKMMAAPPRVSQKEIHDFITEINGSIHEKKERQRQGYIFQPELLSALENLKLDEENFFSKGSFGEVVKVYDIKTKQSLIKKKVEGKVDYNEIEVPVEFPHEKHLACVAGLFYNGLDSWIIQENAGSSLRSLVQEPGFRLDAEKVIKIASHIFQGLDVLHIHQIVHCDIKPENICWNEKTGVAKLVDFGSSKTSQDKMTYAGITPEYLPPNICHFLLQKVKKSIPRLNGKGDVWAGGLVMVFMLWRAHPMIKFFTGEGDYKTTEEQSVRDQRLDVIQKISQLKSPLDQFFMQPLNSSDQIQGALANILQVDEDRRWTAAETVRYLKENSSYGGKPKKKMIRKECKMEQPCQSQNENQEVMTGDTEVNMIGALKMKAASLVPGKTAAYPVPPQASEVQHYCDVDKNGDRAGRRVVLKGDNMFDQTYRKEQQMDKGGVKAVLFGQKVEPAGRFQGINLQAKFGGGLGNTRFSTKNTVVEPKLGQKNSVPRQVTQESAWRMPVEDNHEYDDLVRSFQTQNINTARAVDPGCCLPHQGQTQKRTSSQEVGRVIEEAGGGNVPGGNVPELDVLISRDEDLSAARPKTRAIRRSRSSQD